MTPAPNKTSSSPASREVIASAAGEAPASASAAASSSPVAALAASLTAAAAVPPAPEPSSEIPVRDQGVPFSRYFTKPGENPYDLVEWELRTASINSEKGEAVFKQENCEIPKFWSMMATNVVVSKYFRGQIGTPNRETSVRQLIGRVADTMTEWGRKGGYFATPADGDTFHAELTHILLHQRASFNSPVWFNVGVEKHPQCSACFINSVKDTMASIMQLAVTEGMLFKYGSGTGTNLSTIRSSVENLGGGGTASGPVSFMKGFDAFAGVIKSGGKTRRAAKMVILNADHPDIVEFIECKAREEKKAWALIDAGYDGSFNGEAYGSVFFQNSNNSVRVTDEFMEAYERGGEWMTRRVKSKADHKKYGAREIMRKMADAAHLCGDPGIQFDTTINRWHTCKKTARINASNPCSEYMFLDDSACNLASINLLKYLGEDGKFDLEGYMHTIRVLITAQEIIVSNASYPTPQIGENSEKFRPLGLGYANLGALLMALGVAYDSEDGRAVAGILSSILTGEAYRQSALVAGTKGPFEGFAENRESCIDVMEMHRAAAYELQLPTCLDSALLEKARWCWDETVALTRKVGLRNAQATVIAPTGTIGFMMDCDTTGIEPDLALIKYKKLVGGGLLKIVNQTVPRALRRLGYTEAQVQRILAHIDSRETIEGSTDLDPAHLPVFDCSFRPMNGVRTIEYMGHVRMMAAVQPFISGAISKTVNMPETATSEEIERVYAESWRMGLKALAIYRDGCKRTQPLNTGRSKSDQANGNKKDEAVTVVAAAAEVPAPVAKPAAAELPAVAASAKPVAPAAPVTAPPQVIYKPRRERLPAERLATTHKFEIGNHEGYLTVGLYEDGRPGELFIRMAKEGSTISGLMDSFATSISIALQYGVPVEVLVKKFVHTRFEPSGFTKNREIPIAKSIMDYIFRWMAARYLAPDVARELGVQLKNEAEKNSPSQVAGAAGTGGSRAGNGGGGAVANVAASVPAPVDPPTPALQSLPAADYDRAVAQAAGMTPGAPEATAATTARPVTAGNGGKGGEALLEVPGSATATGYTAINRPAAGGQHIARLVNQRIELATAATTPLPSFSVSGQELSNDPPQTYANQVDAPPCPDCGEITVRNGACYKCMNCGTSLGCG